jgi:hypothetical protein
MYRAISRIEPQNFSVVQLCPWRGSTGAVDLDFGWDGRAIAACRAVTSGSSVPGVGFPFLWSVGEGVRGDSGSRGRG